MELADALTMMTEPETAEQLRRTPATLRRWRRLGCGPPFVVMPGSGNADRVLYRGVDVASWLESRLRTHTGQTQAMEGSGEAA